MVGGLGARAQECKSTRPWGHRHTRFSHSLMTKSKGREMRGGETKKELISVRLTRAERGLAS